MGLYRKCAPSPGIKAEFTSALCDSICSPLLGIRITYKAVFDLWDQKPGERQQGCAVCTGGGGAREEECVNITLSS